LKRARRWALRIGVGAVLFLGLAGPAPGDIGGCGSTNPVASPIQHCTDKEFWQCQRDHFVGRINPAEFDTCVGRIEAMCGAASWPAGCLPTPDESTACIELLRRSDLVHLTTEELLAMNDECNLCM
jgi:hypothetical protein